MGKTQDKQTINQRREDNAMGKTQDKQIINQRREDNAMAKGQDKQTINQRREDNAMANRKRQTMGHKILHRKLKIEKQSYT